MDNKLEITYNGNKESVTIRKLTWGERNSILRESIQTKLVGKEPHVSVDNFRMQELTIQKAIVSAPFNHQKIEVIRDLPVEIGDYLFKEIDAFQGVNHEKKESGNTSGEKSQTQSEKPQLKSETEKQ